MILIPILLARFKVITFNDISVVITLTSAVATLQNTIISCAMFIGGSFMELLFVTVGMGTIGVAK